ncbi:MAG: hypothetical protein M1814_004845 [Vezdaea aestivalis]|nr:MAG: hypothetical protein M1814_004845 [Vezdaea aestivalis]
MKTYLNAILTSLLFITPSLVLAEDCHESVNLFTFGSSSSDYSFKVDGRQPSKEFPLGNPSFGATNNAQGGPNYVQYLAVNKNNTLTLSYDLARGGACVNNEILKCPQPEDLVYQVKTNFKNRYAPKQNELWTSDNTIFISWMGNNDIDFGRHEKDVEQITAKLMDSYFNDLMEKLYDSGARKFFFVTTPSQDRSPKILSAAKADQELYLKFKWVYNDALQSRAKAFQKKHDKDVKSEFFNTTAFMNPILDDPKKYGFQDHICQDSKNQLRCIWNNEFHLVPKMHDLMAEAMKPKLEKLGY